MGWPGKIFPEAALQVVNKTAVLLMFYLSTEYVSANNVPMPRVSGATGRNL